MAPTEGLRRTRAVRRGSATAKRQADIALYLHEHSIGTLRRPGAAPTVRSQSGNGLLTVPAHQV